MTIQYKGRKLDVACLQRISSQCPLIQVEPAKLNFLGLNTESSDLLVHPNGDRFDVLAGKPPEEPKDEPASAETVVADQTVQTKAKKKAKKGGAVVLLNARLVSKMTLKKVEDLTVNGCEVAPPQEPEYREYRPRSDNYDRAQQRFDRYAERDQRPGPSWRSNDQQRRPQEPLPGSLQQSMQKLSVGLKIQAALQQPLASATAKPLESANSHRPFTGSLPGHNPGLYKKSNSY